jgi:hypothetical protein
MPDKPVLLPFILTSTGTIVVRIKRASSPRRVCPTPYQMKLTKPEINSLFECIRESHFVVLGDYCLDEYFFLNGAFSEISKS